MTTLQKYLEKKYSTKKNKKEAGEINNINREIILDKQK